MDPISKLFQEVPASLSFPDEEDKILELWEEIKAFEKQLEYTKDCPEYTFYDGPPFATGLPHYGHLLAGTIKDTVTRYASQTGHFVQRRFGWDCHGLPVEFEIDKTLGITSREEVFEMGIRKYNSECRGIVSRYTKEWERTVKRLGRWIDFENDYKTMNPSFMESVWWVFKQLFEKDLVYQGYKVMPYSTACGTPLSNFEAGLNYKDVDDPAVVVNFPLVNDPSVSLLAWTTTPWTLPSNLALCVNPEFEYIKIADVKSGNQYYILEARLAQLYPQIEGKKWKKENNSTLFTILERVKGTQLVGLKYKPLFDYFQKEYGEQAYRVISDGYVTSDSGTGIVHQAPSFGEDDYRVCLKHGVIEKGVRIPCPVDFNGKFTEEVSHFVGTHVKEADPAILAHLKDAGRLVVKGTCHHSYPFCWRSDTPLIYKAVPSWFVKVEQIKERLMKNNESTYWVPNFVKEGRFHNWLADARDWAVSRNRFWGTPIPIWANEDMSEVVAIGSVEELETLAGLKKGTVTDLHRENIDDIVIPSKKKGGSPLRRVDEVFDCWFESGSMPYAQLHYPFENKERFENGFPANFIAEGLDQTRGWFYTLMVLSTALFDKPAFTNLIVNGMVLAEDGKKMSKRLKNYPDPNFIISNYGADALRMYLINSPVVRAEPLRFKETGVKGVARDVMIPWFNAFRFFLQNAHRLQMASGAYTPDLTLAAKSTNPVDVWILAELQSLIAFVHTEMELYRLYTVMPQLVAFLDRLTKWYVRLNRDRLKGDEGDEEARTGLSVLFQVLVSVTSLMSPFTPFFSEYLYSKLRLIHPDANKGKQTDFGTAQSVHFLTLPRAEVKDAALNEQVAQEMAALQTVIDLGRKARETANITLKKPVRDLVIIVTDEVQRNGLEKLQGYVASELNTFRVTVTNKQDEWCTYRAVPNFKELGKRCGKDMGKVKQAVTSLSSADMAAFLSTGKVTVAGYELQSSDLTITKHFAGDENKYAHVESDDGSIVVALDKSSDPEILPTWVSRELVSAVQKLRKKALLTVGDAVEVYFEEKGGNHTQQALSNPTLSGRVVAKLGGVHPLSMKQLKPWNPVLESMSVSIESSEITIAISAPGVQVNAASISSSFGADVNPDFIGFAAVSLGMDTLMSKHNESLKLQLNGKNLDLKRGTHYFFGAAEAGLFKTS